MKKVIIALILALMVCAPFTLPAFAADGNNITGDEVTIVAGSSAKFTNNHNRAVMITRQQGRIDFTFYSADGTVRNSRQNNNQSAHTVGPGSSLAVSPAAGQAFVVMRLPTDTAQHIDVQFDYQKK